VFAARVRLQTWPPPPSERVALVTAWIAARDVTKSQPRAYCRQVQETTAEQEDARFPGLGDADLLHASGHITHAWLRYDQAPFPSWADAAYLLFPVGAGAAVLLLSANDRGQSRKRLILDGIIVAASLFLISWVTVLDGVFHAGGDTSLAFAVSLAYPIADVAIITIAWARAFAAYRPSVGLVVAGLILIAVSDSVFAALTAVGGYYTGHLVDLGWIIGCGLLGMAALRSIGEPPSEPTIGLISSRVRLWVPYLPLMLACGVGLAEALPELSSLPLAAAGLLIVGAVLARQVLVLAENRRLLTDVVRLAFRDQLTGLANRALFIDRLEQAVERQRREHKPLAVLCLDLDNFKTVNDELGHPAGDELLVRVAGRLSGCLRSTDTVARLGGDEFAILIEGSIQDGLIRPGARCCWRSPAAHLRSSAGAPSGGGVCLSPASHCGCSPTSFTYFRPPAAHIWRALGSMHAGRPRSCSLQWPAGCLQPMGRPARNPALSPWLRRSCAASSRSQLRYSRTVSGSR
jgi:Diguanylate cyclase, GGDEF domain